MITKHLLIKGRVDYADEFDCEFFGVYTRDSWISFCNSVRESFNRREKSNQGTVEVYFGTNEQVYFDSYREWIDSFKITEISQEESEFLIRNFGKTFGTGSGVLTQILEILADENDSES